MHVESGDLASAPKTIFRQKMTQLAQGTTALGGCYFLRR